VEFNVLGPLEVRHDGRTVPTGTPKQQVVLALLAVNPGQAVSLSDLMEEIWGDHQPPSAVAKARGYAAALRRTFSSLEPEVNRIVRAGSGYVLHASENEVDLAGFARDVRRGRRSFAAGDLPAARADLEHALARWRGSMIDGLPRGPLLESRITAIEQDHLMAADLLAEIHLQLGQWSSAYRLMRAQVRADPLRERSQALLMRARYHLDGVAGALEVYQTVCRTLADQLGVEPSPELQWLHRAVLNRDPALHVAAAPLPVAVAPPVPHQHPGSGPPSGRNRPTGTPPVMPAAAGSAIAGPVPPAGADFTGRVREIKLLSDALRAADGSGPAVVVVTGPGGLGKTTLCLQVAHQVRSDFPDGQVFVGLRGHARDGAVSAGVAFDRLLRLLGASEPATPHSIDRRRERFRDLVAGRRLLLVLDDAETYDQVRPLIPDGPGCGVLINSRNRLVGPFRTAHQLLPLDVTDAIDLLARISGPPHATAGPDEFVELARQCGHTPLALRIAGAKLASKPHWRIERLVGLLRQEHDRAAGHPTLVPRAVRSCLAVCYRGLPSDAQRLLDRISELDLAEITAPESASLLNLPPGHAEEALEHLSDARVIDVSPSTSSGYARYRVHDLVRSFARSRGDRVPPEPGAPVAPVARA
jgi:DNA-binding SARP family transcriptional activator